MKTVYSRCRVIDVVHETIIRGDIIVEGDRIVDICPYGEGNGDTVVDCDGLFAAPGFIDGHFHPESTLLTLRETAKLMIPHGTTTVFANPHEIANVLGLEGVRAFMAEAQELPFRVYLVVPCKVPTAPGLETSGASFGEAELREMLEWPGAVGAGEFNASNLLAGDERQLRLLSLTKDLGQIVCGHAPGLIGDGLEKVIAMGMSDDHETHGTEEAIQKIAAGMTLFLREGTTEKNTYELAGKLVREKADLDKVAFCSDDKHPDDILRNGHINLNVRLAILSGMDPIKAVRAATYNCARHYGLDDIGVIAPGMKADIVFLPDLEAIVPVMVVSKGRLTSEDGRITTECTDDKQRDSILKVNSMNTGDLSDLTKKLKIEVKTGATDCKANVIGVVEDQILTRWLRVALSVDHITGAVLLPDDIKLNKVCVIDRYEASGRIGLAYIDGFNLVRGALASSVAHDHHNVIAIGADDDDMAIAIREVVRMGGGFAVVDRGSILAAMSLPIAGLMTDVDGAKAIKHLDAVNSAAKTLGCSLAAPFMTLSFISLPTVPELGITDKGLIDVVARRIIAPVE